MNIRDIADLAGVSVATVSRTINDKDPKKVSAQTRERILKICEQHRYAPNGHMLRMATGRANTIAFMVPSIHRLGSASRFRMDDNMSAAILGAEEELAQSSIFLTLAVLNDDPAAAKAYLDCYRNKTVDGMLVWGWSGGEYLQDLVDEGVPAVLLQGEASGVPLSSVSPQDREGMQQLADHVVSLGHRQIGLITPLMAGSIGRERMAGMQAGLRAHGLEPSWVSTEAGYTIETGYRAGREILSHAPETTCIMASNDLAALGVINWAKEAGLDVPGQLSVTGADGLELYGQVKLTTYRSPSYTIGQQAARLLQQVVNSSAPDPINRRIPVDFEPGGTVSRLTQTNTDSPT